MGSDGGDHPETKRWRQLNEARVEGFLELKPIVKKFTLQKPPGLYTILALKQVKMWKLAVNQKASYHWIKQICFLECS